MKCKDCKHEKLDGWLEPCRDCDDWNEWEFFVPRFSLWRLIKSIAQGVWATFK